MEIPLTKETFTKLDHDNYERFKRFRWYNARGYAARHDPSSTTRKLLYLHREVMNPPEGFQVDHINGDKLDNRRCNLRICRQIGNVQNQSLKSNNKTGYKGVHFCNTRRKYKAAISVNYKKKFLGYFDDLMEAVYAYNEAAKLYHGEFAKLNKIN